MSSLSELFVILTDIILPIFVLIAIGYTMQKKFRMDLTTLARLNIYFIVPGFMFVTLYTTEFSGMLFARVVFFFIVFVFILYFISLFIARFLKMDKDKRTIFSNSVMFFNSGNYGVPVNELVFHGDPYAMSIQVIVMAFQNIFLFSYGVFSLRSAKSGRMVAALSYFRMPVLYALLGGVILNAFQVPLPEFIWVPANYIRDSMISIALLTLGAQVAQIKIISGLSSIYYSLLIRLIGGPLVALGMIYVLGLDGITAKALFVASSMPTSVNSAVIAQEYSDYPHYAAQIVLFSTLTSAITVTFVIFLARVLF
ncbi:AEC family transporter [Natronobacillus azotifigens]|uniref:AEC family transporter n=1 Tax=Natronobacillus azotifigens TaxID=472978 RepID=UPI00300E238A